MRIRRPVRCVKKTRLGGLALVVALFLVPNVARALEGFQAANSRPSENMAARQVWTSVPTSVIRASVWKLNHCLRLRTTVYSLMR